MPDKTPRYVVKSFSLPQEHLDFLDSVAWSRRESQSQIVRWALELLRELLTGE